MTNELEKQFFDAFGIEDKEIRTKDCERCAYYEEAYDAPCYVCTASKCPYVIHKQPQITDHILLELMCILSNQISYILAKYNIEELKKDILGYCITYADDIKHQVQALFKENSND